MRVVLLLLLGALMAAVTGFSDDAAGVGSSTALALGYLVLSAYFAGLLVQRVGLPRLTGYLATGLIVGPEVLGLVGLEALDNLSIFTGAAVALIALTAGLELDLRSLRPLLPLLGWITLVAVFGTAITITAALFLARPWIGFLAGLEPLSALSVAAMLAVIVVAQSPAVVVALKTELRADGPLTRSMLAVVILADLVVVVLFAAASALAQLSLGNGDAAGGFGHVVWELLGSAVAGCAVGLVTATFLARVGHSTELFVLALCVTVAEVGRQIGLDPLLVALGAGLWVRNASPRAPDLHHAIENAALPVYLVFFAIAGAAIHLSAVAAVAPLAGALVTIRAIGFLAGARVAGRLARAPDLVRRYVGFGLLPQAGLALALSLLMQRAFPQLAEAATLTLAVVAFNELIAPAVLRAVLARSGEATPPS